MSNPKILRADVEWADASMLIAHLRARVACGDHSPISTREALEAVNRRQGATVNPYEAAHLSAVLRRIDVACKAAGAPAVSPSISDSIRSARPVRADYVSLQAVSRALDSLPHVPVDELSNPEN